MRLIIVVILITWAFYLPAQEVLWELPLTKKEFQNQARISKWLSKKQFKFSPVHQTQNVLHIEIGSVQTQLGKHLFSIDLSSNNILLDSLTTLSWRWKIKDTHYSDGIIIQLYVGKNKFAFASHSRYTLNHTIICYEKSSVWQKHKINIFQAYRNSINKAKIFGKRITRINFITMEANEQELWLSEFKLIKQKPDSAEHIINYQIASIQKNETDLTKPESVCLVDADCDGDLDIYVVNQNGTNYMKINDGRGRFLKSIHLYQSPKSQKNLHASFPDINNDGWPDLYEGRELSENQIFINQGNLKFERFEGVRNNFNVIPSTYATLWGDFNQDGQCDFLEISPCALNSGESYLTLFVRQKKRFYCKNLKYSSAFFGGAAADIDDDGKLEFFMANNYWDNLLFRLDEQLKIESLSPTLLPDAIKTSRSDGSKNQQQFAEGAVFADLNHDGYMDIYVGRDGLANLLHIWKGNNFRNEAHSRYVDDSLASEGFLIADFDNDMDWDIYLLHTFTQNQLLVNDGHGYFYDGTSGSGLEYPGGAVGAACGDIDNDGDIDVVLADPYKGIRILRNNTDTPNFLKLNLRGQPGNYSGIRSKIFLYQQSGKNGSDKLVFYHQIPFGDGFQFQAFPKQLHFGLRPGKSYKLKVIFSDGSVVQKSNVFAGQTVTILYPHKKLLKYLEAIQYKVQEPLLTYLRAFPSPFLIGIVVFLGLLINFLKNFLFKSNIFKLIFVAGSTVLISLFFRDYRVISLYSIFLMSMLGAYFTEIVISPTRHFLHYYYVREASWDKLFDHLKAFHHGGIAINNLDRFIFLFQNLPDYHGNFLPYFQRINDACRVFINQTSWQISELSYILKELHWNRSVIRRILHWRKALIKICVQINQSQPDRQLVESRIAKVLSLVKNLQQQIEQIYQTVLPHFQCNVIQTIKEVIDSKFADRQIELQSKLPANIHVMIKGYELGNIVADLIENGIRACPEGREYQGQISVFEKDDFIYVDVKDNGKGIPKSLYKKIFDKGFSRSSSGGFGLFYAKETLARYGGAIFVLQSKSNLGTTMRLSLKKVKMQEKT